MSFYSGVPVHAAHRAKNRMHLMKSLGERGGIPNKVQWSHFNLIRDSCAITNFHAHVHELYLLLAHFRLFG